MPFFLKKSVDHQTQIAIWKIEEPLGFFEAKLQFNGSHSEQVEALSDRKKLEWYASRYLIQLLIGQNDDSICLKDSYGKPYLKSSAYHISLSHSNNLAAVIISPKSVGIDIQKMVAKIERISNKFASPSELDRIGHVKRLESLHVIWGAKECIYKAYGKKSVSFKQHIATGPLNFLGDKAIFTGLFNNDKVKMQFNLCAEKIDDYILVYAIEK